MKQREFWPANLNPVKGSDQRSIRPVVVISGNAMNDHLAIGIVCPISSKPEGYSGCMLLAKSLVNGLDCESEVITFQVRTIARERWLPGIRCENRLVSNFSQATFYGCEILLLFRLFLIIFAKSLIKNGFRNSQLYETPDLYPDIYRFADVDPIHRISRNNSLF